MASLPRLRSSRGGRGVELLLIGTAGHELGFHELPRASTAGDELGFAPRGAAPRGEAGASSGAVAIARARGFTPETTRLWLTLGSTIVNWREPQSTAAAEDSSPSAAHDGRALRRPSTVFHSVLDLAGRNARDGAALVRAAAPLGRAGFRPDGGRSPSQRAGEMADVAAAGYTTMGFYGHGARCTDCGRLRLIDSDSHWLRLVAAD